MPAHDSKSLLPLLDSLGTDEAARLLLLFWRTWQVRNNLTHSSDKLSVEGSVRLLQKYWTELCCVRHQGNGAVPNGKQPVVESLCAGKLRGEGRLKSCWEPPQQGWLKVNVDGAYCEASGEGGIGVIIRDHLGVVQLSSWQFVARAGNAEEMEALACRQGLGLAAEWGQQNTVLETDSSSMANMLLKRDGSRSRLKFIVEETLEAGDSLPQWKVVHKRRESNSVAHELAQLAKRNNHSALWRFAAPVCVEHQVAQECTVLAE